MMKSVRAAGIIFEDEQGEVLVLRRRTGNPEGGTWGLVGGKAESEESGKLTAIRKAKAEIGHEVNPDNLEFIKTYHWGSNRS
jgi:8-oxo-dGTP pyrophosphatase MutT (NUDIX family)